MLASGIDPPLPRAVSATIAVADRLRHAWLRTLGAPARRLVVDRELRVALVLSTVCTTALIGTLLFPLWLLALGPIVWGVPHLVADVRYMVVRTGFSTRRPLWIAAGLPLLWLAGGGPLIVGFIGTVAVAVLARASIRRRVVALVVVITVALGFVGLAERAELVFGHAHNFFAIALWWGWRRRRERAHWVPLVLLVAATALLLSPLAVRVVDLAWAPDGVGRPFQLARLAGGDVSTLGLRLVLVFCFAQTVHYAIWLHLLPDEDRDRRTVVTFRKTVADLRRDLGDAGLAVAVLLSVALVAWALLDLADANRGYFRVARFHGHLELMAATLLLLERPRR